MNIPWIAIGELIAIGLFLHGAVSLAYNRTMRSYDPKPSPHETTPRPTVQ